MPAIPSWLLEPLWDQFAALLPDRPVYDPAHPLGCHQPRIADRIIFEKLIQVLRFGCSYASIADCTCGATTIRERRNEWIKAGIFGKLKQIARESYDRIVGLVLEDLAVDGCITKAPGGGDCAGRSPADRGKLGMKRSLMVEGKGIPLGRVLAPANRHDSPLLVVTLDNSITLSAATQRLKALQALLSRHIAAISGCLASSRRGNAALRSPTSADAPEQPVLDVRNQPDSHRPRRTERRIGATRRGDSTTLGHRSRCPCQHARWAAGRSCPDRSDVARYTGHPAWLAASRRADSCC